MVAAVKVAVGGDGAVGVGCKGDGRGSDGSGVAAAAAVLRQSRSQKSGRVIGYDAPLSNLQ